MKTKFEESNYVFFQPNPSYDASVPKSKQILHEDCSIRGICAATEKTWEEVYDLLFDAGKKVFDVPSSDMAIEYVLSNLGFTKHTIKIEKGKKRENVSAFVRNRSDKRIVMRISNHIVGGHGGKYYDSWNCGYKCVYTYYEKEL